jgi:hypothetical protein
MLNLEMDYDSPFLVLTEEEGKNKSQHYLFPHPCGPTNKNGCCVSACSQGPIISSVLLTSAVMMRGREQLVAPKWSCGFSWSITYVSRQSCCGL